MDPVRLLIGLAGGLILMLTFATMLRTMVVPRGLPSRLVYGLWSGLRRLLNLIADPFDNYEVRDRMLAWLAPLILVGMLAAWLAALFLGYGLIMHATAGIGWKASFREAGSSLFTLGYASTDRLQLSAWDFLAAASGPLVIALQIAYLPTLYSAYNRRETEVTLLLSRAGEPAWGPELLARQGLVNTEVALPALYRSWERLAAELGESHASYPVLLSFRSPQPYRSWIVGLVAVMDAAALHLAISGRDGPPEARLVLRAGFTALRDIARVIRIDYDPDPDPETAPLSLTYEEFVGAVALVQASGFDVKRPAPQAWPHFRGWRVNYEHIAYELCRRGDAVPALWTGPRDFPATPIPPRRPPDRRPRL
jgi:hypothetical protein